MGTASKIGDCIRSAAFGAACYARAAYGLRREISMMAGLTAASIILRGQPEDAASLKSAYANLFSQLSMSIDKEVYSPNDCVLATILGDSSRDGNPKIYEVGILRHDPEHWLEFVHSDFVSTDQLGRYEGYIYCFGPEDKPGRHLAFVVDERLYDIEPFDYSSLED